MNQKVYEGTWAEVTKQVGEIDQSAHVRLEVFSPESGSMIQFGMFPQLAVVSEEDFVKAEWRLSEDQY